MAVLQWNGLSFTPHAVSCILESVLVFFHLCFYDHSSSLPTMAGFHDSLLLMKLSLWHLCALPQNTMVYLPWGWGRSVFQSNKWKDEKNWLQVVPGKSNECFKSYSDRDSAASLGRTYWHSTILMDCFLDTQPKHSLLQLKDTILYLPQYTWRRTNCNIIWLFQNQHLYLIVCISQVASTSPFSFPHAVSFWFSMSIILISLTILFAQDFVLWQLQLWCIFLEVQKN